jgi:hypothetical protein
LTRGVRVERARWRKKRAKKGTHAPTTIALPLPLNRTRLSVSTIRLRVTAPTGPPSPLVVREDDARPAVVSARPAVNARAVGPTMAALLVLHALAEARADDAARAARRAAACMGRG